MYILYFVSCYQVISFVAQIVPSVAIGGSFTLAPVSLCAPPSCVEHLLSALHSVSGLILYIFCPSPGIRCISKKLRSGCPCCYWGGFIFNTEEEWSGKRFHTFVQILLDLKSISVWYLAFTGLHHSLPVYSFLCSAVVLLNTTEPSWVGLFREQSAQAVYHNRAIPGSWSQRSLYWDTNLDGLELMGGQWNVAWIDWDTRMLKNWFGINLGDTGLPLASPSCISGLEVSPKQQQNHAEWWLVAQIPDVR